MYNENVKNKPLVGVCVQQANLFDHATSQAQQDGVESKHSKNASMV